MANSHLWNSPRIRTLDEIEWQRKENSKRRFRRVGLVVLYALIIMSFFVW